MAHAQKAPRGGRQVETAVKDENRVRDRRQQLIDAAVRVFMEKGFHETTVRDIGKAADLTQGTIYNYVRSKDDILYLACDHVVTAYQDAVRHSLASLGEREDALEAILRAVIETMYDYQDYILLIYHESHALNRDSLHSILARVEEFVDFIKEAMAAAGVHDSGTTMHIWANIVTFLPTMVALRRWLLRRVQSREEVIDALVVFMLKGLDRG
jgi:AcrR family transcriptional regulator